MIISPLREDLLKSCLNDYKNSQAVQVYNQLSRKIKKELTEQKVSGSITCLRNKLSLKILLILVLRNLLSSLAV